MWKYILIIVLVIGFVMALWGLVELANKKDASPWQLAAMAIDIAYFPSAAVLILWLLGII